MTFPAPVFPQLSPVAIDILFMPFYGGFVTDYKAEIRLMRHKGRFL